MLSLQRFESLSDEEAIEEWTRDPSEERARWMLATFSEYLDTIPQEHREALLKAANGWLELAERLKVTAVNPQPHAMWSIWADRVLDAMLGFSFARTEADVPHFEGRERADPLRSEIGRASWSGSGRLTSSTLNTPYSELFRQVAQLGLEENATLCDLGCAYGRLGFVVAHLHPTVRFYGYEIVGPRVREANRVAKELGLSKTLQIFEQDASAKSFTPPECDLYFLYDPFNRETLLKVLNDLQAISERRPIKILARGKTGELQKLLDSIHWLRVIARPSVGAMPWSLHQNLHF